MERELVSIFKLAVRLQDKLGTKITVPFLSAFTPCYFAVPFLSAFTRCYFGVTFFWCYHYYFCDKLL